MFKIEVKNDEQFSTLGTEFLDGKLIVYGFGFVTVELEFYINGKSIGQYTYESKYSKSFYKISMNNDEIVILEEPVNTGIYNETVLIPEAPRVINHREIGTLYRK